MSLTDSDLKNIASVVRLETDDLRDDLKQVKQGVNSLTNSTDQLLHTVRRHEDERLVLRAQQEKIRNTLVAKGIVTEDELAVA